MLCCQVSRHAECSFAIHGDVEGDDRKGLWKVLVGENGAHERQENEEDPEGWLFEHGYLQRRLTI